jgi:hypothetical protein
MKRRKQMAAERAVNSGASPFERKFYPTLTVGVDMSSPSGKALVELARAAGFYCSEDADAVHSLLQAQDGNNAPLHQRLREKPRRLSNEEYKFLNKFLADGGMKNPANRPPKAGAEAWRNTVALMVVIEKLKTRSPHKVAVPRVRERLWGRKDKTGGVTFLDGAPSARTIEEWVAEFRGGNGRKMDFARALIEHEKEIIAEAKELAKADRKLAPDVAPDDPRRRWNRPVSTITLASIRSK